MSSTVLMPRNGQSVESCIINKWFIKKGDAVEKGDILFSYETDKATFDHESEFEGYILETFFNEGDEVPVLTEVCVIGDKNEAVSIPATGSKNGIKISPRAKALAKKLGIDFSNAVPSGPKGRIIEKDILKLSEKAQLVTPAAREEYYKFADNSVITGTGLGGRITTRDLEREAVSAVKQSVEMDWQTYYEVALTNIRKVIAKTMQHSISSSAQLTLNTSFDATDILDMRKRIKVSKDRLELENITVNDMIIYAVSRTILNHRDLNAHFLDDRILYFKNVHLGVAVDTERGLMVPNLFNANLKSLNEISAEVKKLVKDCQAGTINPDMLKGGSFTITNLGTLDIESFTPVLNPPQTGILGVNTIVWRAREVNGECEFYPAMGLSLTFDHRALDGAPAAKFIQELKRNLENFSVLLAK